MSAAGLIFGHEVRYDDARRAWLYRDNGEPVTDDRPCPKCGELPTADGHDPCIANLPGVVAACCGHGVEPGYAMLADGTIRKNIAASPAPDAHTRGGMR